MIFVENFVNTSDQVIVVAMITGAVSITGVVISSIVAKIVEYKYNVKKYLYDKREEPYKPVSYTHLTLPTILRV